MGIVIFTGLSIGTLFTLFVVPAMYLFLAEDRHLRQSSIDDGSPSGHETPEPSIIH
jgi:multidrug efflux pump